MNARHPVVLIGPVCADPAESVSGVNQAFIAGLRGEYSFLVQRGDRRYGLTRQARLNLVNIAYVARQLPRWCWHLVRGRPKLAHYGLNSGWAMEKGLVFLQLARMAGARVIAHLHSGFFLDFWEELPAWRKRRAEQQLRRLNGLVVLSDGWRRAVLKKVGLPESRIFTVNNPIDEAFESAALSIPLAGNRPGVLSLGVMDQAKGAWDIMAAAKVICGKGHGGFVLAGPEREPDIHRNLRGFIQSNALQESVQLRGSVWGEEKFELFRQTGIFLLPSHFENFPLVLLEAAAAGQAIVTTPVGAIPEFFEDGVSALFVQPGNVAQIVAAVTRLLEHPEDRYRLAAGAREVFNRRLARKRIMADMRRVYQTVLSRPAIVE